MAHVIRETTFSGGAIQDIIEMCTLLPQLTSLIIKDNNIGDGGAKDIATMMGLHTLDLSHNSIGDEVKLLLKQKFPFAKF